MYAQHVQEVDDAGQLVLGCRSGAATATQRVGELRRAAARARGRSRRARGRACSRRRRATRPSSSARSQTRGRLHLDAHDAARRRRARPRRRAARRSRRPGSPASPGVSIRLILRPCHSTWQSEAESDICRRCSSSSQSETVVPCLDGAEPVDRAGLEEHRLDERGLPGPAVADDGDVADLPWLDCRHAAALLLATRLRPSVVLAPT